MKKYLLMLFSAFFVLSVWAQERTITGTVTDGTTQETVPGANVIEKGTTNGTTTDLDGNFSLSVQDGATLIVSFVGYQQAEIVVGARSVIDVSLELDVAQLAEVVVVGYGTQEKKEITSSVASVKAEDFNQGLVNNPAQLIQGKVGGLTVAKPGGDPNGNYTIRLRGVNTFGAQSEPLVVIDGVIGGSLGTVDPNDIASIDVLKDGSAAAIYGTRGSAGVILITTKAGVAGKTQVDYNASVAFDQVANTIEFFDAAEYRAVDGANDLGGNTDWVDEVTSIGVSHVHNLSMSGGAQGTTYRASINLRDVEGIGIKSGFTQVNARLNLTQKALNDNFTFQTNLSITTKDSEFGFDDSFRYAITANPTLPVFYSGTAGTTDVGGYAERDIFDFFNPVAISELNDNDGSDIRILGSFKAEYDFSDVVDGLRASVFYSQQRESEIRGQYFSSDSKFGGGNTNSGNAARRTDVKFNELIETTLNYDNTFGITDLSVLAGYSYQDFFNEGFGAAGGNFLTDAFTYNNLGASLDFPNGLGGVFSYANSNRLIAFFGRVNLNIDGTYFISASARQEGSSRFGEDEKWGLFPAISAGVNITNLVDLPGVDQLKFRGSWGQTGNQPSQSYLSLRRFGPAGSFFFNGNYIPSYGPQSNPNPNLKWEVKNEIDFGIDFSLNGGKISGTVDWYQRNTTDLLFLINVPVPPNLFNQTWSNVGEMKNTGFEFAVDYLAVDNGNFSYKTGVNFATFNTEIVALDVDELFIANMGSPGQNDTRLARVAVGEELGQLWLARFEGINEDGTVALADLSGDGAYDPNDNADKYAAGNGLPDFTVGWNNSLTFGRFDLNLFFRGAFGHDLLNSYRGFYENFETTTVGNYNIVRGDGLSSNLRGAVVNDSHVEDASFLKLDNATISYNFPIAESTGFRKFRMFFSVQNAFVITGYKGIDPEVRYEDLDDPDNPNALAPGIERRNTYFTTRAYTVGFNLGF